MNAVLVLLMHVFLSLPFSGLCATLNDVMRAAGYNLDGATSVTSRRSAVGRMGPCYTVTYNLSGETVLLSVDPGTSEILRISGRTGRGPNPTSDTANLTANWARQTLLSLNPYKISRGLIRMGEPTIHYDPDYCDYVVRFPRLDAAGHLFEYNAAAFDFDHGTSKVTGLDLDVFQPEPSVTTGTMISQEQATSNALQWLIANRSKFFQYVPDKMTFDYVPESTIVRVVTKDATTDTAVAYKISRFESRLTDPYYTGRYERVKVLACVDVFSGALVAGDLTKMVVGGQ